MQGYISENWFMKKCSKLTLEQQTEVHFLKLYQNIQIFWETMESSTLERSLYDISTSTASKFTEERSRVGAKGTKKLVTRGTSNALIEVMYDLLTRKKHQI